MTPLSVLFLVFAVIGLLIALVGHAGRSASVAPSMYRNDISPVGYAIFIVCILIALAAGASAKADEWPPYDQCTPRGDWNAPNCKCWDKR